MQLSHVRNEAGFTFAELAFGMLILVIGAVVLINHLSINYLTTATERDRVFAYTKAQAILSEIQGFVDRGNIDAAVDLDVLDDGIVNRAPLTIQTDSLGATVAPDHVVSGNFQRGGAWVWSRRITVQPFLGLNNRNVRYVTVRIFRKDRNGNDHPMADLSAVINSAGKAFPTSQVFDVYLLAVENIPGWWVFMDSIKPFVESMITDLENRNPGLVFRTHWITKASMGRNLTYRPYTNETTDSYQPIPDVYHYPGRMPSGNASTFYYVPDNMRGRINVDGTEKNGYDVNLNPRPYALADFFNHAMRYPDELALWQARKTAIEDREAAITAAIALGDPVPPELGDMSKEPTMRLFLEDLYSSPAKYKNALIINLHGELLPMPALRNYSDAAKEPVLHPEIRAVTHPEELRTKNKEASVTDSVQFRVYAYDASPATHVSAGRPDILADPIVLEFPGLNLTDPVAPTKLSTSCTLSNVKGGVSVGGTTLYSTVWLAAKHISDGSLVANEMRYRAEFVNPGAGQEFTRIYLYNTPVVAPLDTANRGLANTTRARLYQMEYIPCPTLAGPSFGRDLTTVSNTLPKNTARWTLRINPNVLTNGTFVAGNPVGDVLLQVRTRIGSGEPGGATAWRNSGTVFPGPAVQPDNLSATYAWWTDSAEDVPITERSQFNGDPRHLPYKDCFNGTVGTNGLDYLNTYNWYHDSLINSPATAATLAADYPAISGTVLRNRWSSAMSCDVPRYFELFRRGLTKSACVYTTLTGFSYYYLGIGNDIGYDSGNGYPNSIPSDLTPHGVPSTTGYINTIIGARRFVRAPGAGYWWGMPWLGELFPDNQNTMWLAGATPRGNLAAGTAANKFYQDTANSVYVVSNRLAYGTTINNFLQRTAGNGCTCFFNIGTTASSFHHVSSSGNGTLTAVGLELANNYNMTMPTAAPITRPFGLTLAGSTGEEFSYAPYSTKYKASLFRTYYTHAAGTGSGLVKLVDPGNTTAAYVVVNGISNAVENGTTFISKFAVLSLVHSFFEAGSTSNTFRIPQLPRLEIESPTDITELNDPSTIQIQYAVSWTRWDGVPYAASGTYAENESLLQYVIMYSNDGGANWYYAQDNTVATPGERPTNSTYIVNDLAVGNEVFDWSVPSVTFPEGSYTLRVDCYRQGAQVHYSYHKAKIFIQR
ncbi:MAG: hypothetical protein ABIP94_08185 [Planctomycetota bacterium]